MTIASERILEFWKWFDENSQKIAELLDKDEAGTLAKEITGRVKKLHPDLSWEIGTGKSTEYSLTVSAAKNRKLRSETSRIISLANKNARWEFYPARQPREIPPQVDLISKGLSFKTADWHFHAVHDKDKHRTNLFVIDRRLAGVAEDDALSAVFLFL